MKKFIKTFVVTISSSLALLMPALAMPIAVYAEAGTPLQKGVCGGASLSLTPESCANTGATTKINQMITKIINIFSIIVGVIAVIFIIIGGIKYVTSGGEANNITAAKNTIMYAIVGLVIVALAQVIVKFVLNKVVSDTA